MSKTFHTAFGVYGVISQNDSLLVINKNGGPYINRFDLPGGSLDEGEAVGHVLKREVKEETGLKVIKAEQLGTISFRYPWKYQHYPWNNHICVFYDVQNYTGKVEATVEQFIGQDSLGAKWVNLEKLDADNSSPLVLKAKEFLLTGKFHIVDQKFEHWLVK